MSGTLTQERPRAVVETAVVWRLRLLGGVLLLAAVAFRQAGGLIVPDTKFRTHREPRRFSGSRPPHVGSHGGIRSGSEPGPTAICSPPALFTGASISAGVPEWVVQRLWWTTTLLGRLPRRVAAWVRHGTPWARYLGALLYAVGPRFLSEVAVTSVEVWPMAVAPWVVLPLVVPGPRTWRWRITRSALAFAAVGGVNAVASGSRAGTPDTLVCDPEAGPRSGPALRRLARCGRRRVDLVARSPALLGRYSPPLPRLENAPVTTAFASPFEAVRGTTPWLNYLSGPAGPAWPAGWQFVTLPTLVFATASLAAAGLVGVRLAPRRHRLALSLLVGLLLVTAGHTGAAAPPIAEQVQHLLDGPPAPLRNTHKFEPGRTAPAHHWAHRDPDPPCPRDSSTWSGAVVVARCAVSCVALLAAPAVNGGLARPEGYQALPGYWRDAATWLMRTTSRGRCPPCPPQASRTCMGGSTKDDPLQALSEGAFAVRDAVPLGSAGTTRWLDAVERSLQSGTGGAGLRAALVSAGIRHVVLRNDLSADAVDSSGGQSFRSTSRSLPSGLDRVATFGPAIGAPPGCRRSRLWIPSTNAPGCRTRRSRSMPLATPTATVVTAPAIVVVDGGRRTCQTCSGPCPARWQPSSVRIEQPSPTS